MASGAAPERLTTTATVLLCYAIDRQKLVFFPFTTWDVPGKQQLEFQIARLLLLLLVDGNFYTVSTSRKVGLSVRCHTAMARLGYSQLASCKARRKFKCTAFQEHNLCRGAAMSFNQARPRSSNRRPFETEFFFLEAPNLGKTDRGLSGLISGGGPDLTQRRQQRLPICHAFRHYCNCFGTVSAFPIFRTRKKK